MGQAIETVFICGGRYRVHAIGAVGRRRSRIIEVEEVDTGERFHGTGHRLHQLVLSLCHSNDEAYSPSPG